MYSQVEEENATENKAYSNCNKANHELKYSLLGARRLKPIHAQKYPFTMYVRSIVNRPVGTRDPIFLTICSTLLIVPSELVPTQYLILSNVPGKDYEGDI